MQKMPQISIGAKWKENNETNKGKVIQTHNKTIK